MAAMNPTPMPLGDGYHQLGDFPGSQVPGSQNPGVVECGWTMEMVESVTAKRSGSGEDIVLIAVAAKDGDSFPNRLELTIPVANDASDLGGDIQLVFNNQVR